MKLTDKEMEVMVVLWDSKHPMTATEIIETSSNRTWKERSIYTILNMLIKKGIAILTYHKPTITNSARAYAPAITSDEYMVKHILSTMNAGVRFNIPSLIKHLTEVEVGEE
jgi:predicted transcriptional regulator